MTEAILALPQEEKTRLMNAINIVVENNPAAVEQFEKLAMIKRDKPLTWKMLIAKLKNF